MILGQALAPYLGVVATRCALAQDKNASAQLMSRAAKVARDDIASLKIAIPNWYVTAAGGELGTGGTATVTASIEYPAGSFTQVLFSGSASGSIPDLTTLLSDPVSVAIPAGAGFFVRIHWVNAAGIFVYCDGSSALGDRLAVGASIPDNTMSGSVADSVPGYRFAPIAVVATTSRRSALLIGTSRTHGNGDTYDASGDVGVLARSIGQGWGYINAGIAGDTTAQFIASHALRAALQDYVSDVVIELGPNDNVFGAITTVEANLQTIGGYFAGKRAWIATDAPYTDTSNVTVVDYAAFTAWKNAVPSPYFGAMDIAGVLTSAGKWGKAEWMADGIHPSRVGNLRIKDFGVVRL